MIESLGANFAPWPEDKRGNHDSHEQRQDNSEIDSSARQQQREGHETDHHHPRCLPQTAVMSEGWECHPQRTHHQSHLQTGTRPDVLRPGKKPEEPGTNEHRNRDPSDQVSIESHCIR